MNLSAHPLWLVGFRPFFTLAFLSGLALPVLWVFIFVGALPAPPSLVSGFQWHAHEMFFGFGWAVLGGFLLTASKNWVKVRGFHGGALIFLTAAWLFERAGMWFGGSWPVPLFQLSSYLFLVSIVAMILWTLIRHRRQDAYRDNPFFMLILPLFVVAKALMLSGEYFPIGWSMAIGLFRVAFLLMLERTLTQFMQGVFKVPILRNAVLDTAIKVLALAMIFESLMPSVAASAMGLCLAALLTFRFAFWKPQLGMQRLDLGIIYLGYAMIVAQLLVAFFTPVLHPAWVGAVSVHVFAFGVMGFIMPAMLIRISKGHTGRKVVFDRIDKLALWSMIAAFVFRLVVPQVFPAGYAYWIYLAAACWFAAFATLAWRYIPYLLQPRVDGKEH
jgi:uncharacterized protein involved in response to NO